jgi:GNAT superfamily N-acetyltransferase
MEPTQVRRPALKPRAPSIGAMPGTPARSGPAFPSVAPSQPPAPATISAPAPAGTARQAGLLSTPPPAAPWPSPQRVDLLDEATPPGVFVRSPSQPSMRRSGSGIVDVAPTVVPLDVPPAPLAPPAREPSPLEIATTWLESLWRVFKTRATALFRTGAAYMRRSVAPEAREATLAMQQKAARVLWPSIDVRRLYPDEEWAAFELMRAAGRKVETEQFERRLWRLRAHRYELFGAFADGDLVGVLGVRVVETLARGDHLHVDEIVVDESARGAGVGAALLEFAEYDARARGLNAVFLDGRPSAFPDLY